MELHHNHVWRREWTPGPPDPDDQDDDLLMLDPGEPTYAPVQCWARPEWEPLLRALREAWSGERR